MISDDAGRIRKPLLVAHLAAMAGVVGGDLALVTLGLAAAAGADPAALYPAAHLVALRLVTPFALATLLTGIGLGLTTRWGLFRYGWVAIKLAITVSLTAAILLILLPGLEAAAAAAAAGAVPRNPLMVGPVAASALLLVALILSVAKPAWPLGRSRRRLASQEPG